MGVHWVVFVNVLTGIPVHKYRKFLNWFSNYQIFRKILFHVIRSNLLGKYLLLFNRHAAPSNVCRV